MPHVPLSVRFAAAITNAARHRPSLRAPLNVLVIGPAWVGDMIMAQSLFQLLRQHGASAIDVVAPAWTEPLLARMPEVRATIPLALGHGQLGFSARWRLGRGLRGRHYQRAIVLPNSWKSALPAWAARIPRRTGYVGELRYGLLNDARQLNQQTHWRMVDRFLALALEPGEPLPSETPMPALRADAANGRAALARLGLAAPARPVLGVCPGAEYGPAKRWPEAYYAEVVRTRHAAGWDVWLFGSSNDAPVTRAINAAAGGVAHDLAGRTTLADAIDLMALTRAIVTNDSGLMHVAAALGRPLVAVFGSSDPTHTPPLSPSAEVAYLKLACSPCFERECPLGHLRCLRDLDVARVQSALDRVTA